MDTIIFRQHDAAKPLDGKGFVLSIAGIIIQLAIAQFVVNLLISLTGTGLLNLLFYLYAVVLLVRFMKKTVANYVYTLKGKSLVLERRLGDSTITVVEIPLEHIVSLRPVRRGERLAVSYRQVTVIDPASRPPLRVRAAFVMSLLSAKLARRLAGKGVDDVIGQVVVFMEGDKQRACVFCPNEKLLEQLAPLLGDAFGFDERMTRGRVATLYGRALERAFPALYPYVEPLVSREQIQWAREEVARQKAEKLAKKQKKDKAADEKQSDEVKSDEVKNDEIKIEEKAEEQTADETDAKRRRRKQG